MPLKDGSMNWLRRARDTFSGSSPAAASHSYRLGDIAIDAPWARAPSPTAEDGGGFLTLVNKGETADRLIAASSPAAARVEIHGIKVVGADLRMCALENGLALAPGATMTLKPRGYHLLLIGLRAPLEEGGRVPVTLVFEKAGSIDIELAVAAAGLIGWNAI
jgi:copper(I)-binding protein